MCLSEGHLTSFTRYLDPDFKVTAPNYLPWGGTHSGAAFFRDEILPNLPDVFDFARFSYDSVIAEGGQRSSAQTSRALLGAAPAGATK